MNTEFKRDHVSVVVVGCVESTEAVIKTLSQIVFVKICGVVTSANSQWNSDFLDLRSICYEKNIKLLFEAEKSTDQLQTLISKNNVDICFVVGWSSLIPLKLFRKNKTLAIGYHPALLPKNRGRHPIIWSLVLGMTETGSTFFELAEDADAGDIINQRTINITPRDTSRDLYNKLLSVIPNQVNEIIHDFFYDILERVPQDHNSSSYWRKRTASDGLIDWRMSSSSIYNLVRALVSPYPGADFMFNGQLGKVHACKKINFSSQHAIEPGRILDADGETFQVKTGDGVLLINDYSHISVVKRGDFL